MHPSRILLASILSVFLPAVASACSQCLSGNPVPACALGDAAPGRFRWGFEERRLSKANAMDDEPGVESSREHRLAVFGAWRARECVTLLVRAPYAVKELRTAPAEGVSSIRRTRGPGDLEALAILTVVRMGERHPFRLDVVAGGSAPTGADDLRAIGGERYEAHLQPGTGAWSATLGVNASKRAGDGEWTLGARGRVNERGRHGYRYGGAFLCDGGFEWSRWKRFRPTMGLDGRAVAHDVAEDGTAVANTGGAVLYVAPGLRWAPSRDWGLEAGLQVPVAQSLAGDQTEHATARVTLEVGR